MATLLLAACQSPDLVVSAIPPDSIAPIASTPIVQPVEASVPMPIGAPADAPSGYVAFCARQPAECADAPGKPDFLVLNPDIWRALQQTNSAFNAAIRPEEDAVHYGRADYWTIPTDGYGDCEDYALAKRKALVEAGFSPRALRIAVARSKEGEAHAVLTVATDRGDYVLDNLIDAVLPWKQTNLGWIARQMPDGAQWASLSEDRTGFRTASIAIPAPRP
jgi:predicted transglutaminase-like cysteine proteinase